MFQQLKIQNEDLMLSSISSNDTNNGTDKGVEWFQKTMKTCVFLLMKIVQIYLWSIHSRGKLKKQPMDFFNTFIVMYVY